MSTHRGVSCDLCRKMNFSHRRYKCLVCNDFDLCSTCYDKKVNVTMQMHSIHHPMQLILTSNDYEHVYFGHKRTAHSPMSLTCSLCNKNGFSLDVLIKHINEQHHVTSTYSVLCPICFTRQQHLVKHLHTHTQENIMINPKIIKQIKSLNFDEKELKSSIKSNQQSLLEKLVTHHVNENEYKTNEKKLFLDALLTDLICEKSFDDKTPVDTIIKGHIDYE